MFILIGRDFLRKNQQDWVPTRTRLVEDGGTGLGWGGGQWSRCLSLGNELVLGGGGVTNQVISDSVFQGKRNCLLVICFICIFIFAVLRLQEGLV